MLVFKDLSSEKWDLRKYFPKKEEKSSVLEMSKIIAFRRMDKNSEIRSSPDDRRKPRIKATKDTVSGRLTVI